MCALWHGSHAGPITHDAAVQSCGITTDADVYVCLHTDRCRLDIALYSEARPSETEAGLYPVNALRNRALIMASTEVRPA